MHTTSWSHTAWQTALPVYEAILQLPFVRELADGTLSRERFNRYIGQDSLYINQYCKILAHIASRLADFADTEAFLSFAADGVAVEKALHSLYIGQRPTEMSPACLFYTSLLHAQATENVAIEAAAILPCFWIYLEVGLHIVKTQADPASNPYSDWIATYSDPAFAQSTRRAIEICDRLAANTDPGTRQRMTEIFLQCARQEWLFWHTAYTGLRLPG